MVFHHIPAVFRFFEGIAHRHSVEVRFSVPVGLAVHDFRCRVANGCSDFGIQNFCGKRPTGVLKPVPVHIHEFGYRVGDFPVGQNKLHVAVGRQRTFQAWKVLVGYRVEVFLERGRESLGIRLPALLLLPPGAGKVQQRRQHENQSEQAETRTANSVMHIVQF